MNVGRYNLQSKLNPRIGGVRFPPLILLTTHVPKYFSHSPQLSISSWTMEDAGALDPCGHCNNFTRSPDSIERKDVTMVAWQLLKSIGALRNSGGKLTTVMFASLARGLQGGSYEVSQGGKNGSKEKVNLDLEAIAGGAVDMNRTVGTPLFPV